MVRVSAFPSYGAGPRLSCAGSPDDDEQPPVMPTTAAQATAVIWKRSVFMPTTLGTTGPRRRPCLRTSPLRAGTHSLWASDKQNVATMSAMRSDLRAPAAVGVASLSVLAAGVVVVLLPVAVVQGPWGSVQRASVLQLAACLLAGAAVSTSLGLVRTEVGWHADGTACAAIAVCLAAAVLNGWEGAGDPVRIAGGVVAPAMAPVALSLVERRVRARRRWAAAGAATVVALAGASYVVRDPFHDVACWSDCAVSYDAPLPSDRAAEVLAVALAAVAGRGRRRSPSCCSPSSRHACATSDRRRCPRPAGGDQRRPLRP